MNYTHTPVLLHETIDNLAIKKEHKYIDATIGGGGHTGEILKRGGIVLGIDQDKEALQFVQENFKFQISHFKLKMVCGNFRNIGEIARENGFEKVAGILFDLGFSSYQLENSGRGFSFLADEKLDMRMGGHGISAFEIVNQYSEEELYDMLSKFGEEPYSRAIAKEIVITRRNKKIETSRELSELVKGVKPEDRSHHPATLVFQALRIAVNDELGSLREGLAQAVSLLEKGGRLAVISFHSLEDRIVKNYFRGLSSRKAVFLVNKKPIIARSEEIESNPRARSAKLRVIEKK